MGIRESDFYAIIYLAAKRLGPFKGYYSLVAEIEPLIRSSEWAQLISGFYINVYPPLDSLRLTFFTAYPNEAFDFVIKSILSLGLTRIQSDEGKPSQGVISRDYGGEELRFRRFLAAYTQLGLDLISTDLAFSRCLMAALRFQLTTTRRSYREYIAEAFEKLSHYYNALTPTEKDQLWSDLQNWPDPNQVDWVHFLVNMVLPGDLLQMILPFFSRITWEFTHAQINQILEPFGYDFRIPESWSFSLT